MGERCLFRQTLTPSSALTLGGALWYLTPAGVQPVPGIPAWLGFGGTGYALGDKLTIVGGNWLLPAKLLVTQIGIGGRLLTVSVAANNDAEAGAYTSLPAGSPAQLAGSATGSGAQAFLTWTQGMPPCVKYARIIAENANVRFRRDRTPPTTTVGELLLAMAAGVQPLTMSGGAMLAAQFIQASPGATLDVEYLR